MGKKQKNTKLVYSILSLLPRLLSKSTQAFVCAVDSAELDCIEWVMNLEDTLGCRFDDETTRLICKSLVALDMEKVRRYISQKVNIKDVKMGQAIERLLREWEDKHSTS